MKLKEHINYSEYNYTEEEFEDAYKIIKSNLTTGLEPAEQKRTIILGGQPGSGKSTFYEMREDFIDYVAINGDEFRRFHPRHKELESDIENYAKNTQKFSNAVVEKLIKELGDEGYSLIIEGTLRSYEVPVKTCEELKSKGYHASLVVIACDAEESWKSTIIRAEMQKEFGLIPRFVQIDNFDHTVKQIEKNIFQIEQKQCFDDIFILERDGKVLYNSRNSNEKACEIIGQKLNINNWNERFSEYKKAFEEIKDLGLRINNILGGFSNEVDR